MPIRMAAAVAIKLPKLLTMVTTIGETLMLIYFQICLEVVINVLIHSIHFSMNHQTRKKKLEFLVTPNLVSPKIQQVKIKEYIRITSSTKTTVVVHQRKHQPRPPIVVVVEEKLGKHLLFNHYLKSKENYLMGERFIVLNGIEVKDFMNTRCQANHS
ncbi:hypothetical protein MEM_02725 [Candida albicans L26]|uniref:Uncharacterized protein n=1 Tax=Candida albicans P78048 TaxID=1094989 RepID=A0AB34PT14_CANAX|nr:hypothetical protein MG1_02736 [Candida albicans GC75]KGR12652.1 hypothetical protein MG3_02736 [Candida albicans P78048]KGR17381.1 hypothetical protein MG9_02729 [Candida albicans P37037]KGT70012.1 hypothetical protein MEK_02732 [Candida albicans 12C]KGU10123.1 hypothetical protein MEQ_02691 [Candida albicans P87]KGU11912.1 hypothetical protein MEY_02693 [Candida albicans 19F]KGU12743.1 hypothetical protein MEM_02725 [Candida albicans L26]KGU31096.1 putative zinc-cluster protein [Candida